MPGRPANTPMNTPLPGMISAPTYKTIKVLNPAYKPIVPTKSASEAENLRKLMEQSMLPLNMRGSNTDLKRPAPPIPAIQNVPQWLEKRVEVPGVPIAQPSGPELSYGPGGGGTPSYGPSPVAKPQVFAGSSTGNAYNAGQTYTTGGGMSYVANADGTFSKLKFPQQQPLPGMVPGAVGIPRAGTRPPLFGGGGLGALLGSLFGGQAGGIFGGGQQQQQQQISGYSPAEQASRTAQGMAIGEANRRNPNPTYNRAGANNAFQPRSVQNSVRWQTGY